MDGLLVAAAFVAVMLAAFAAVGAYVASVKGRSAVEGALLGFLVGPIGILVEALLPTGEPPEARDDRAPRGGPTTPEDAAFLGRIVGGLDGDAERQETDRALRALGDLSGRDARKSRGLRKPSD